VVAERDCEQQYAAARTRAETLAVDERPLVFEPADKPDPETCGSLRRGGTPD
jgi:hypothetical protein